MGRDSTGFGCQLSALSFQLRAKNKELTAES
jgi:hypothetical protein